MTEFPINRRVDEQNHLRCHGPEHTYIRQLDQRGMLLRLGNVLVDAEQVILRTFRCNTLWCLRPEGEGATKKFKGSCCTDLEVDLTADEIERLKKLGRVAKKRLRLSPYDPLSEVVHRLQEEALTEETSYGEQALRHTRSGRCILSWMDRDGSLRCGLNTLCARLDLPLTEYKPDPCFLYPLHFAEPYRGIYFVTLISPETYEYIGAHSQTAKMRCLRRPEPGAPPAYVQLKWEIILLFGESFYNELAKLAEPILKKAQATAE